MADLRILSHWPPKTPFPCLFCDAQPMPATDTSFFRTHPVAVSCHCLSKSSLASVVMDRDDGLYVLHVLINRGPLRHSPNIPLQGSSLSHQGHVTAGMPPQGTGGTARLGH